MTRDPPSPAPTAQEEIPGRRRASAGSAKPASLDPDGWMIVKTPTVEGQKILDRVGGFMREVGVIVRSHHERWDRAGYPDGLAGDAIPLEARHRLL